MMLMCTSRSAMEFILSAGAEDLTMDPTEFAEKLQSASEKLLGK